MMKQTIPVILGPTASGKTAYAIALAKKTNGAIISADSRQVYAGMNIGTAKPKEAWKTTPHAKEIPDIIDGIPHYLINIASIDTPYTLSDWLADAKAALEHIIAQGQNPIIAGGTMLYIDALADGYSLPSTPPNTALRAQLEQLSPEELYTKLISQDPDAANFIEPHNSRRIIRALEVMHATGKKFSELRTKTSSDYAYEKIGIFASWETVEQRITKRSQEMLREGLEQEKKTLAEEHPNSPLLQTVNYKEHSVEEMIRSNIRYAHRQMSWWKRSKYIGWICV